jgi:hypothetical protein
MYELVCGFGRESHWFGKGPRAQSIDGFARMHYSLIHQSHIFLQFQYTCSIVPIWKIESIRLVADEGH